MVEDRKDHMVADFLGHFGLVFPAYSASPMKDFLSAYPIVQTAYRDSEGMQTVDDV